MDLQLSTLHYFRVILMTIMLLYVPEKAFADCANRPVGVESPYILPDTSLTATSYTNNDDKPSNGRLNFNHGWGARKPYNGRIDYLQIDLGLPYVICAVATQGSSRYDSWTTQYKIDTSLDGTVWTSYQDNGQPKIFPGNIDRNSTVKNVINKTILRYIRFIPTTYHNAKTLRVEVYGYTQGCENLPLGMDSGAIPDGSITASSTQYPAKNARLYYTSGSSWCASTSDSSPYLQIDLGSPHLICAVATQGNSITDQWVKTYQINTSSDGTTWTTYQENNIDRTFYGNYDRATVVRRLLYHGVITRYLRIVPKTYQGGTPCLRTEIYGYLFQPGCSSHSVGIPSSSLVPDHRFIALTSERGNCCNPYKGRLGVIPGWLAATNTAPDYLQVDLGDVFYLCAVATQGHGGSWYEWVTRYKVLYSTNNKTWTTYRNESGNEHEFNGNSDRTTVVTNPITNPFRAKFVRVFPTAYHRRKMLRIDFKGLPSGCTSSLGIENSRIPDSQMTSSDSSHLASRGRLYGSSSWCSLTTSNTEYIQVDLGQTKTVTGIATQGDNSLDMWVTSYNVSYSFDNRNWNEFKDGQVAKVFSGNSNKNDVIVNWFNRPIAARYVRILPQTSSGGHCLRLDLYGCAVFVTPKVILDTAEVVLPAIKGTSSTLSCSVMGEPTPDIQWFNNETNINGATQTTLQVQFISAEDVLSNYNCTREDPSTRAVVCNTVYTCRIVNPVYLPNAGIKMATGKVTVNLNVPEAPNLTASPYNRSITVTWNIVPRDDVGHILSYTIQFNNESTVVTYRVQHPAVNYSLQYLKPYTRYSIRMNAISTVGQGVWSSWPSVTTSIAVPDGIPVITMISAISSQAIEVHFQFIQSKLLNGPMAGFRVYFTPEGGPQQHTDVGNVTMTILTNLKKYTNYTISVAVRNTLYAGPPSSTKQITTLQDVPDGIPVITMISAISSQAIEVHFQFNQSKLLNGPMAGFRVYFTPGGGPQQHADVGNVNMTTLTNLRKYTDYTISVSVRNTLYAGPPSSTKQTTTLQDAPDCSPILKSTKALNSTCIRLTWEAPGMKCRNGILRGYKVMYKKLNAGGSNISTVNEPDALAGDIIDLERNTKYEFQILAFTVGDGPWSDAVEGTTKQVTEQKPNPDSNRDSPIAAAMGSVAAVLLILAIVIVIVIFWKRRSRPKSPRKESRIDLQDFEEERGNINEGQEGEEQKDLNDYSTATSNQQSDDVYAEPLDNSHKAIPIAEFLGYVRSMKSTDYARLKEEYTKIPNPHFHPKTVAQKPVNKKKNRYGNTIPYDHSRVVIARTEDDEDSDYINASYIRGYDWTPKACIASQGPVVESFPDFWQMIWEQNTCTIVMLTNLKELGKTKCHQYWPESKETYRDITVNNHKTEMFPDYIIRTFLLAKTNSEEKRRVYHFQFTVWPDKGVPHYATAVLGLRRKVKAMNPQDAGPIVIHCSAGIGRTGCYIVIDAMLERARNMRNLEIKNYVSMIREDRTSMVQTAEQYVFIHTAILEALSCGNTEIEACNLQLTIKNKLSKTNPKKNASGYAVEFKRLNAVTSDYAEDECDIGTSSENESKNRYPNVIAMNHSRVKLMREETSDYINASFVDDYRERNAFILTQAPLETTIEDFWIMVVNYDIRTVVMLNALQEEDMFPQYWPQEGSETYGDVTVELLGTRHNDYIVARSLQVSYRSTSVLVQHLLHLEWPDKSIPVDPQSVLTLLNDVQKSQRQAGSSPVVVQCSNGVGRSGTFCAISSILERMKQEQVIDVFQVIKCIRSNRPGAVESLTQYMFCYQIIQNYLDSFSDYANFSNC